MKGQWLGTFAGTNAGHITVNMDELEGNYAGHAVLHNAGTVVLNQVDLPLIFAPLVTPDKKNKGEFANIQIQHIDPATLLVLSDQELAQRWPGRIFSKTATAKYSWTNTHLDLEWSTPIGASGYTKLPASKASLPSAYTAKTMTWQEFKGFAESQPYRKAIFRGQEQPWRLRTAFHRSGRSDLFRYAQEDIRQLYGALASRTRHSYNLQNPEQHAALIHLAQHHGYPTPLLDWSYSPYVAVFCAFRRIGANTAPGSKARIFMFDHVQWQADFAAVLALSTPTLHVTVLESVAFDNDRSGPQQSLSLVTNLDDVETYIQSCENRKAKSYLTMIDVAASERGTIMRDLSRMGISAASMFPGLDGVCEELRERRFP